MTTRHTAAYVRDESICDAPEAVAAAVRERTVDTLAAVVAGHRVEETELATSLARDLLDGDEATVLDADAGSVNAHGASFANGTAANSLDIDEGHRIAKGHPAAIVVPPALSAVEANGGTVGSFLDAVLVGYEVAVRAAKSGYAVTDTYTGTGSWGAVGVAAAVAKARSLSVAEIQEALSVAEYHSPRTPIMMNVANPGMTKDGIGWGALSGHVACTLAERGFTGSGTYFDHPDSDIASTFGDRYEVTKGYYKPYPACRWAHPGLDAALSLREAHDVDPGSVRSVRIHTFTEATELATKAPSSTDAAEYAYPYFLAVALRYGRVTPAELRPAVREQEAVTDLASCVELHLDSEADERFPEERTAWIEIETDDGTYRSDVTHPSGAPEKPLSTDELHAKQEGLFEPTLSGEEVARLRSLLADPGTPIRDVVALWTAPR